MLHKQQVRQHLKSHLRFPSDWIQGTVRLRIALDSEGILQEVTLLEATDSRLAQATLKGVQSAEPFPRFPKEFKTAKTHYEFLVQYRVE